VLPKTTCKIGDMLWVLDFIYGHLTYLVISTATRSLHKDLSGAQVGGRISWHQRLVRQINLCVEIGLRWILRDRSDGR
jgi:hypothetical protein